MKKQRINGFNQWKLITEDENYDLPDQNVKGIKILEHQWKLMKQYQKRLLWYDHMKRMLREFAFSDMKIMMDRRKWKTANKIEQHDTEDNGRLMFQKKNADETLPWRMGC